MQNAELQAVVVRELGQADLRLPDLTRVSGPVYAGPYSAIFRVDLSCPMALKICQDPRTGAPDPAFARRQFEELSRIHQGMGDDPRYRVPRPILLIEEQAILLMEWVIGETLGRRLRARGRAPAAVALSVEQAGAWLRRFHDSGPRSQGGLPALGLLGEVRELLEVRAPGLLAEGFVQEALGTLAAAAPGLDGEAVERSWLHGDYQMENLVLAGESIVALDVAFSRQDAVVFDMAYFLNALDRFLLQPKGWHLVPFRSRLLAAFLRGYGKSGAEPGPGVAPRVLHWMRIHDLLRFFAIFHAGGKSRLHDWYFAGNVRLLLRRLGAELGEDAAGRKEA